MKRILQRNIVVVRYKLYPSIFPPPASEYKKSVLERRLNSKKWRREWELNPPEPVLQTVALAARPSRQIVMEGYGGRNRTRIYDLHDVNVAL